MAREKIDDFHTVIDAAAGRDARAQNRFGALVVQARLEVKFGIAARPQQGPAGEAARDFTHVLLRVSAIDAQGVKLHDLARIVFIEAAAARVGRHSASEPRSG